MPRALACFQPLPFHRSGRLKVLTVLEDNQVTAARAPCNWRPVTREHWQNQIFSNLMIFTNYFQGRFNIWIFFFMSLDMINVAIYCVQLWECSIWHKAKTKAWEILLLVNISWGKKLGHLPHSAHLSPWEALTVSEKDAALYGSSVRPKLPTNTQATKGQANLLRENVDCQETSCHLQKGPLIFHFGIDDIIHLITMEIGVH